MISFMIHACFEFKGSGHCRRNLITYQRGLLIFFYVATPSYPLLSPKKAYYSSVDKNNIFSSMKIQINVCPKLDGL